MLPCIVRTKPLRNRPEHTSTCYPDSSRQNLGEHCLERTSTCYPASSRYNLYETVRSKPPHATPDPPDTTVRKSSGAILDMLHRIVKMKPLRARPEQTSTCFPDRPNKTLTKSSEANLHIPPSIAHIRPLRNLLEQTSTCFL